MCSCRVVATDHPSRLPGAQRANARTGVRQTSARCDRWGRCACESIGGGGARARHAQRRAWARATRQSDCEARETTRGHVGGPRETRVPRVLCHSDIAERGMGVHTHCPGMACVRACAVSIDGAAQQGTIGVTMTWVCSSTSLPCGRACLSPNDALLTRCRCAWARGTSRDGAARCARGCVQDRSVLRCASERTLARSEEAAARRALRTLRLRRGQLKDRERRTR